MERRSGYLAVDPATNQPIAVTIDKKGTYLVFAEDGDRVRESIAAAFGDAWAYGDGDYPPRLAVVKATIAWERPMLPVDHELLDR